ncbi:hypothetical protein H8959_013417 [Pygathrix nigripes]
MAGVRMTSRATDSESDLADIEEHAENSALPRLNNKKAKGRVSYVTATENEFDTQILTFRHITKAQEKTRKRQQPVKLPPLIHQPYVEVFSPSPPKLPCSGTGKRDLFRTRSLAYPKYTFHDREEVVKANIRDPLEIIKIIRENEHLGFLYMIPAVPRSSIEYDAYNLKIGFEETRVEKGRQIEGRRYSGEKETGDDDEVVTERLGEFRNEAKYVVRKACRFALHAAGFVPDDCPFGPFEGVKGKEPQYIRDYHKMQSSISFINTPYELPTYGDSEKMTYTEQASKRHHCMRLTCFIHLNDYLIENILHVLTVNAVNSLLNHLTDKLKRTPSADVIQKWITEEKPEVPDKKGTLVVEKQEEDESLIPMFLTELMLTVQSLLFEPSLEDFLDGILGAVNHCQNTVLSVPNLVPDTYFDAFTSPYINNKLEEKTCGTGPSLAAVFEDDKNFHTIISQIKETIQAAFESARLYAATFEKFQIFFKENESLDLQAPKLQEPDVNFFSEQLEKYHKQHKDAVALRPTRNVGLLLIDTRLLREKLIPSPLRCLEVLNFMLPHQSKKKVDAIIFEAQDAEYKLEFVPTTTTEYVHSLLFLDEIQERIESLEDEGNIVTQMYKLIEQYQVPTPPEDFAVFATMKPSIVAVQNAIDKSVGDRESSIKQFCVHLGSDLEELNNEVNEVKLQAQDPQILDISADQDKIRLILNNLQSVLADLQKRAFQYKSYQKKFKVEVSKFETLEEVSAELKLKQLLWDSFPEWDELQQEWLKVGKKSLQFLNYFCMN